MLSNSLAAFLAIAAVTSACAQSPEVPDSPGYLMQEAAASSAPYQIASSSSDATPAAPTSTAPVSPIYPGSHPYLHRNVKPDMGPQPLSSPQKFELSFLTSVSPMSFVSNFISAGWSHMLDNRPHYGTDRGGFGERLGAAKVKQVSENFLSYGLWASAFHEDPHYYIMGSSHPVKARAIHAATSVVITRKDSGGTGVNWARLVGMACSNALDNAYYPDRDRGAKVSATAFASNVGITSGLMEIDEFLPDVVHAVHHKKSQ